MTESEHSTVVGIFTDRSAADSTLEELRQAGFGNEQLRFITHDADTMPGIAKESQSNQVQSQANRIFVTVNSAHRYQEASDILRRNGGHVTTHMSDIANSDSTIDSSARTVFDDHGPDMPYVPFGTDR